MEIWKCDYCHAKIQPDHITEGWIKVTAREGKVVLIGCPKHSHKIKQIVYDGIKKYREYKRQVI